MMRKVVVACDSFKGSLTSHDVAEAFAEGWHTVLPECEVCKIPIADGGEGSVDALVDALSGEYIEVAVHDPLNRIIVSRYGVVDGGNTAVIEMSAASGITHLTPDERNPMQTSTYGTGELIADALRRGCRRIVMCIGGSATNDGGMGMLRALGFRLLDAYGVALQGVGADLERLVSIDSEGVLTTLRDVEIIVASDVDNPLYGAEGAAVVYAPQKGADAAVVAQLDRGLRNYAEVVSSYCGFDVSAVAGAGAAGGLGAALIAILGARLERGINLVLDALHFDRMIVDADLVVTGEGRIDRQSVMGKAPIGVLRAAQMHGVPVVAIGGDVVWCDELRDVGFVDVLPITTELLPLKELMRHDVAYDNVRRTAASIAQRYVTR